jgi:hypothetical protein
MVNLRYANMFIFCPSSLISNRVKWAPRFSLNYPNHLRLSRIYLTLSMKLPLSIELLTLCTGQKFRVSFTHGVCY